MKLLCIFLFYLTAKVASEFSLVSEEIDSSEFGLAAGKRPTNCSCGWTNKGQKRIVGGSETKPNEYPLMAGLTNPDFGHLICGASVISAYHGLTAAHCTINEKQNRLALYLADHDVMSDSSDRKLVHVKYTIEHEKYNTKDQQFDISLLVLQTKIDFSQIIGPACLPTTKMDLLGKTVKIIGWGKVRARGSRSRVLRKVNLKVVPIQNCADNLAIAIPTTDPHQICTFGNRKDACKGDSGGPVLWLDPDTNRYTQVAIVSFGAGCGGSTPAVNTDLLYFIDWLQSKIANSEPMATTCSKN